MIDNKLTFEEINEQMDWYIQRGEEISKEIEKLCEKDKSKMNEEELLNHLRKLFDLAEELEVDKICVKNLLSKFLEQAVIEGIIEGLKESGT